MSTTELQRLARIAGLLALFGLLVIISGAVLDHLRSNITLK